MSSDRTIASIRLRGEPERNGMFTTYPCGCENRIDRPHRWRLCQYHEGYDDAAEKTDELQGLIDVWAAAIDPMNVRYKSDAYPSAEAALLAAATKRDTEGEPSEHSEQGADRD